MDDLLIRHATLYDGSGADPIHADLAVRARPHPRHRPIAARRRQANHRRRRPRVDARHHRQPHALRRAAHVGSVCSPLAGAGRDHGGDRQLRLHHRAVPAARPRADDAQPHAGGRHVVRGAAARRALGVRDLCRIPGAAAPHRLRDQPGRVRGPLVAAHVGDGRRRQPARRHRGRGRADGRVGARGHGRRRGGPGELHQPGAQRRRRRADALAPGHRRRAPRAHRGHGRERPRRLHGDQGRTDASGAARADGRARPPPGDDRGAAAQRHQPGRGVRRPRCHQRRQPARPPIDRAGVVLPADDGLHHGLALPGGGPGELEARARPARQAAVRRAGQPGVPPGRAR